MKIKKNQIYLLIAMFLGMSSIAIIGLMKQTHGVTYSEFNIELGDPSNQKDYYVQSFRTENYRSVSLRILFDNDSSNDSSVNIVDIWLILDYVDESTAINYVNNYNNDDDVSVEVDGIRIIGPSNGDIYVGSSIKNYKDITIVLFGANNTCDFEITTIEEYKLLDSSILGMLLITASLIFASISLIIDKKNQS